MGSVDLSPLHRMVTVTKFKMETPQGMLVSSHHREVRSLRESGDVRSGSSPEDCISVFVFEHIIISFQLLLGIHYSKQLRCVELLGVKLATS